MPGNRKPLIGCRMRWGTIAVFLFVFFILPAQNQKHKLNERKSKLEQEITSTNRLLDETKKNKANNLNQLYLINKKISHREDLIQAIGEEVKGLDGQIGTLNDTIFRLTNHLDRLKKEYARLIYSTYRNRDAYSRLMFVFSSKNFNQAYKRLKYLQQYTNYRKQQVEAILGTQVLLGNKKLELEKQKSSKLGLKQKQEYEKNNLTAEKSEKDNTIKKLTKQEKNLLRRLKEKEAALSKLQRAIEALVAEEIRKANEEKARKASNLAKAEKSSPDASASKAAKKAESPGKSSASNPSATFKSNSMSASAEEVALSNSFSGNRGRLPWPVERGNIASSFGEHPHPEFKNIKVRNNGVDISVPPGSQARAVFEGVVSSVMSITNLHYVVIIRHGDFLSVYSNLKEALVKKGDKVRTRQPIGVVFTDAELNKTLLHFEIWNGTTLQNPGNWLGSN